MTGVKGKEEEIEGLACEFPQTDKTLACDKIADIVLNDGGFWSSSSNSMAEAIFFKKNDCEQKELDQIRKDFFLKDNFLKLKIYFYF